MFHLSLIHTTPQPLFFLWGKYMTKTKNKEIDLSLKKQQVSQKHIEYYDQLLEVLGFILEEYSKELTRADI